MTIWLHLNLLFLVYNLMLSEESNGSCWGWGTCIFWSWCSIDWSVRTQNLLVRCWIMFEMVMIVDLWSFLLEIGSHAFKNCLQQYAQHFGLPLPAYETIREGPAHLSTFRSSVTVGNVKCDSLPGCLKRKEAEQSSARVALLELSKKCEGNRYFITVSDMFYQLKHLLCAS